MLCTAAARIQSCIRPGDLLARPGGDEFAVLMGETDGMFVDDLARRMCGPLRADDLTGQLRSRRLRWAHGELVQAGLTGPPSTGVGVANPAGERPQLLDQKPSARRPVQMRVWWRSGSGQRPVPARSGPTPAVVVGLPWM